MVTLLVTRQVINYKTKNGCQGKHKYKINKKFMLMSQKCPYKFNRVIAKFK